MKQSEPIVKDLVLIGGGHSHAIVLKLFGIRPLPGVRITLITEAANTPYTGMLPGHVAGFYSIEECHIDLRPLAEFAQAQLYVDQAIALDLVRKQVICAHRPAVGFDLLSIDIGSTPTLPDLPGVADYSLPAKPIRRFLEHWHRLVAQVNQQPQKQLRIAVVGGGTGGVELSLAVQRQLHQILQAAHQPLSNLEMHLFHRGEQIMPGHTPWVRQRLQKILIQRGIALHLQETVCEVQEELQNLTVGCVSGLEVLVDYIIWVTQASAPDWLAKAGLATDAQGFVQVDDTLRSLSHPFVFAAGDIAAMVNHPRPKAGVFAVRQGKPLFQNLRRVLQDQPLKAYHPQKNYLSLIGTSVSAADPSFNTAIASRGILAWESPLIWRWKDWIDRRFMQRFQNLTQMAANQQENSSEQPLGQMRCGGCGAKVGASTLEQVLARVQQEHLLWPESENILIGLEAPDDGAVVQVPPGQVMVHTLDYFPSFLNDPFLFGQICANHSLSDLFAMGATPQTALAIATIPAGLAPKVEETLYQVLAGAAKVLAQSQTTLVGGHTTEGAELAFGLSCNGLANPDQLLRKAGMQPGQVLILSKALGTGTLFAAQMRLQAKGNWIDQAIESMLLSNQAAATCFLAHQTTACTDITGFGLLGHLGEMVQASGVSVELDLATIPILAGALETLQKGITSSLQPQNLRASRLIQNLSSSQNHPLFPILFDPQTSGGLLAAVPQQQAEACLRNLFNLGYNHSRVIGRVKPFVAGIQPITLSQ